MQRRPHHAQRWAPDSSTSSSASAPSSSSSSPPQTDEAVFRRVRGILNKLTVERFGTLVDQLITVGISNENILRGIIILLFEKALDEPKFSPMYAQVCLKLSEQAPNFETTRSDGQGPTTFLRLLLGKCQDEFENRSQACELAAAAAVSQHDVEPGSEAHHDQLAKQAELNLARRKMLGNIRFIGELGKLNLLSEKILHACLQQLLTRVRTPVPEDIECLCKLMSTIGKQLDHKRAKAHMDKYFARMDDMRRDAPLPMRIKFMLEDVIDLRRTRWEPRRVMMKENGPKTIVEIRRQAVDEQLAKASSSKGRRNQALDISIRLMKESEAASGIGPESLEAYASGEYDANVYGANPNAHQHHNHNHHHSSHGVPAMPGNFHGMTRGDPLMPPPGYNSGEGGQHAPHHQQQRGRGRGGRDRGGGRGRGGYNMSVPRALPATSELSLRPAAGQFRSGTKGNDAAGNRDPLLNMPKHSGPGVGGIDVKQDKKSKPKLTQEELDTMLESLLVAFFEGRDVEEAVKVIKSMRAPKFIPTITHKLLSQSLERGTQNSESAGKLLAELEEDGLLSSLALTKVLDDLLTKNTPTGADADADAKATVSADKTGFLLGCLLANNLITIKDVIQWSEQGDGLDLVLPVLQTAAEKSSQAELSAKYATSKVDLARLQVSSESARAGKLALSKRLGEFGLDFLYPYLRLELELVQQLEMHATEQVCLDPSANGSVVEAMSKWIQETQGDEQVNKAKFVFVLAKGVFERILCVCKGEKIKEKLAAAQLLPLIQKYTQDSNERQVAVVYALQVACKQQSPPFPGARMLHMAVILYDDDVVEEDAWMAWREDLNDEYPGKGDALIAINEYLNWMNTAEEEDSDEDDEEDSEVDD